MKTTRGLFVWFMVLALLVYTTLVWYHAIKDNKPQYHAVSFYCQECKAL